MLFMNIQLMDPGRSCQLAEGHVDQVVQAGCQGDCGDMVGYVDDGKYSYAHADPAVLSEVLTSKYNLLEGG